MRKQRVLVVDDDEPLLASVKQTFELAGYKVDLATTAHEALLRSKTRAYNLALIALVLPDMQGLKLLEQLRVNVPSVRLLW
jgi:DNA-binding response OmpR family regulator